MSLQNSDLRRRPDGFRPYGSPACDDGIWYDAQHWYLNLQASEHGNILTMLLLNSGGNSYHNFLDSLGEERRSQWESIERESIDDGHSGASLGYTVQLLYWIAQHNGQIPDVETRKTEDGYTQFRFVERTE